MPAMAIGRASALARPPQLPPMPRQVGRGRGRVRAQLLPPPPGLAAIHCLPAARVVPLKPLNFRGGFTVSPTSIGPAPFRVMAEVDPSSPMVRRYGFPEAEVNPPRSPSLARSEQRVQSPGATVDDAPELHVDPPAEWVMEEQLPRTSIRPTRKAGSGRPGCWNCGEFGHSRVTCTRPRQRMFYMCPCILILSKI